MTSRSAQGLGESGGSLVNGPQYWNLWLFKHGHGRMLVNAGFVSLYCSFYVRQVSAGPLALSFIAIAINKAVN